MSVESRLASIQVGKAERHGTPNSDDPMERAWTTAFFKQPVQGPLQLSRVGLEGDEQHEKRVHGGPEMAALAYSAEHYPVWRAELGIPEMGPGGFGENLTVSGLDEERVCIGDVFEVGGARVQVSKPRGPCANISKRWKLPSLLARVTETGRTGWYLRVLEEGTVEAGQAVRLLGRPFPEWTVRRVFRLRVEPDSDPGALERVAGCEALSPSWRRQLAALGTGPRDGS